ncbi:MAG: hypothetical protein E7328_02540 [Clostridiales bacterium]|nr:hypothetical protein [Clostridiales bacterium]
MSELNETKQELHTEQAEESKRSLRSKKKQDGEMLLSKGTAAKGSFVSRMAPIFLAFLIMVASVYGFTTVVLGQDGDIAPGSLDIAASEEASDAYALGLKAAKEDDDTLSKVSSAVGAAGIAIKADGNTLAIVASEEDAKWVLDTMKDAYEAKEKGTFTSEFKEEVTTGAASGELTSKEEALIKLTSGSDENTPLVNVISTEVVEKEKTVAYSTVRQNSSSLYVGETQVKTKGVNGTSKVTTTITYENGKETKRESKDTVVKAPVNKVVLVGTKKKPTTTTPSGGGGVAGAPSFRWPTTGTITSRYGYRTGTYSGYHKGLDIANSKGTPIYAAAAGTVIEADDSGWGGGYGTHVQIKHNDTYTTLYAHMSKMTVRYGQKVSKGQVIGYMGATGAVTGVHLHFEVIKNGSKVNPEPYLP